MTTRISKALPVVTSVRWARLAIAIASFSLCAIPAHAQGQKPREPEGNLEVVTLPEFSISESRSINDWSASQALIGTRTSAPLLELPFQVHVVTQQFIDTFDLFSLTEQMAYFPGLNQVADLADPAIGSLASSGLTLRGFPLQIRRDGFNSHPPPSANNTAQIELINGPISTLYGSAEPGGIVNYVSKRPTVKPVYKLSLGGGSYGFLHSNFTGSGPLYKDKLFMLVAIDNSYRRGPLQYTYARTGDYMGTLLYKPTAVTSFTVNYERVHLIGARGATIPSLLKNTVISRTNPLSWSGGTVVGVHMDLARQGYSRFGPNEHYYRDFDGLNAQFVHAFNRNWQTRISYEGQWKHFDMLNRTNSNVSAETGRMTGVKPYRRQQSIITPGEIQGDVTGEFTTGAIKHKVLGTFDYAKTNTRDLYLNAQASLVATLPPEYSYQDPAHPYWPQIDYTLVDVPGTKNYENLKSLGGAVGDRLFLPDKRTILMANLRYDKVSFLEDQNTAIFKWASGNDWDVTYALGINYKLRGDGLVLFANHSTSFNTNPTVDTNTGSTIPNERGRGVEAGLKSTMFGNRLSWTLSGFNIEKLNIGQTNPDYVFGNGLPQYLGNGKNRVLGVDLDVNSKPTTDITLRVCGSYLDPRVMSSTNASLVNTRMTLVPLATGSIATEYKFGGPLKGLVAGATFRYAGSWVLANPASNRPYREYGIPKQLWNAALSYNWTSSRVKYSARLSGVNVTDKFYLGTNTQPGLGRQINLSLNLTYY